MMDRAERPGNPGRVDLRELWQLLAANWGKLASCLLLTVGLALAYLHYAQPVYASRALLEVAQDPKASGDPDASADLLTTMQLKIASQPVLLGVIKANNLTSDPDFMAPESALSAASGHAGDFARAWGGRLPDLARRNCRQASAAPPPTPGANPEAFSEAALIRRLEAKTSVSLLRGSRLIAITVEDHDPAKAQRLAQSVIDQFFHQAWDAQHQDVSSSRDLLLAEARRAAGESKAAEERLQAYREKFNAVSLTDTQDIVVLRLRQLNQQVAAAKNARLAVEPDRDQIRRLEADSPELLLNIRSIAAVPEVADLRKAVALQEAQIATLAKRYGPLHPTLIQARGQLDELQASLNGAIRKGASLVLQSYLSSQAMETALEAALAEQEKAALDLDRLAIPYHALEREVEADSRAYQQVLDRLEQADVNHGLMATSDVDGSNLRIVERPLVPVRPVRPARRWWLALSVMAGLFLGGGWSLAAHAMDNTVSSVDGAETFLDLPVLITIPRSRDDRLNAGPVVLRRPASTEAESFRSLRTALSLLAPGQEQRSMLFASALPGEGKSYCSLNYAAALAQQGLRTLLIDGDLRRPRLCRSLAPESGGQAGLSDCLRQPELFPAAARPTAVENLFLLGDLQGKPGSAELLARDGLAGLIRRGLEAFDRVVIDSAPLIPVSDTLQIAKHVETICLVVHAGKTPRRVVRRACHLLEKVAHRTPLGVILNKIPRGQSAGYHYYYTNEAYV